MKPTLIQTLKRRSWIGAALLVSAASANAYLVTITAGTRTIYLQVGAGTMTGGGGRFNSGGVPGDNSTINKVSVTVPATALGTGSQPMSSDSTVALSPWDGYNYCTPPAQVYVGGFYRVPGAGANATLTVTTPTNLVNATADTIPFSSISWTSAGNGDTTATIPTGSFGGTQTLLSVGRNSWFESCLTFSYSNASAVAAGTFNGRATYTLTAP